MSGRSNKAKQRTTDIMKLTKNETLTNKKDSEHEEFRILRGRRVKVVSGHNSHIKTKLMSPYECDNKTKTLKNEKRDVTKNDAKILKTKYGNKSMVKESSENNSSTDNKCKTKDQISGSPRQEKTKKDAKITDSITSPSNSFLDLGWKVKKIVGVSGTNGSLAFLIEFEGKDIIDIVPVDVVYKKMPQMVIQFFEEFTIWYH